MSDYAPCNTDDPFYSVTLSYETGENSGNAEPQTVYYQVSVLGVESQNMSNVLYTTSNVVGSDYATVAGSFVYFPTPLSPTADYYQLYVAYNQSIYLTTLANVISGQSFNPTPPVGGGTNPYQIYTISNPQPNEVIVGISQLYPSDTFNSYYLFVLTGQYTLTANKSSTNACQYIAGTSRLLMVTLNAGTIPLSRGGVVENTPSLIFPSGGETQLCFTDAFKLPGSVTDIQFPVPLCGASLPGGSSMFSYVNVLSIPLPSPPATPQPPPATTVSTQLYQSVVGTSATPTITTNVYTTNDFPNSYIFGCTWASNYPNQVLFLYYQLPQNSSSDLQYVQALYSVAPLQSSTPANTSFSNTNVTSTYWIWVLYNKTDAQNFTYRLPLSIVFTGNAILSDYCLSVCTKTDSGNTTAPCNTGVNSFCQGSLLLNNICTSYCLTGTQFDYDCDNQLISFCQSTDIPAIGSSDLCACFLSTSYYENYYYKTNFPGLNTITEPGLLAEMKEQIGSMSQNPACSYLPCSAGPFKPRVGDTQQTCPAEIVCLAAVNIDVSGGASFNAKNVKILQPQQCTSDTSFSDLYDQLTGQKDLDAEPWYSFSHWYMILLAVAIVIFIIAVLVLLFRTTDSPNSPKQPSK